MFVEWPGKRIAIGLTLRAMAQEGIGGDFPVVFMDGDCILEPGCVMRLPFFKRHPDMHALTSRSHWCTATWRCSAGSMFASRSVAMQSPPVLACADPAGRLSLIRAAKWWTRSSSASSRWTRSTTGTGEAFAFFLRMTSRRGTRCSSAKPR